MISLLRFTNTAIVPKMGQAITPPPYEDNLHILPAIVAGLAGASKDQAAPRPTRRFSYRKANGKNTPTENVVSHKLDPSTRTLRVELYSNGQKM